MTLDAYGRFQSEVWLDISLIYKLVLKTSGGTTIWTEDNIQPVSAAGTSTFTDSSFRVTGSSDSSRLLAFEADGITSATTRTVTAQDKNGTMALTSDFAFANLSSSGRLEFPLLHISGLRWSQNSGDPTNDIDITDGHCRDGLNLANIVTVSTTKRLDASWAVGNGQGGLDGSESVAGTPDISTWYYIYAIKRSDTGVTDFLFSESSTAPTYPTNYTYSRLIGAVYNNASGNIDSFTMIETAGGGASVKHTTPTLDVNLANTLTTSRRTDAIRVPPAITVFATVRAMMFDASAAYQAIVCSTSETDAAPTYVSAPGITHSQNINLPAVAELRIYCTAGTIAARANIATVDGYTVVTLGWDWTRV